MSFTPGLTSRTASKTASRTASGTGAFKASAAAKDYSSELLDPGALDQWFPPELQQDYVQQLRDSKGLTLTRRQAECWIRLWGYGLIKKYVKMAGQLPGRPLDQLEPLQGGFCCSQRQAAELFYANTSRGSDRSAGLMIDTLRKKKLLRKQFDGNETEIIIHPPPNFDCERESTAEIVLDIDDFNPRTDAVPVASFLVEGYDWMPALKGLSPQVIMRGLRAWARQYPAGMRVLRRQDNQQAVGFYCFFPTDSDSDSKFFEPPSQSLFLFSKVTEDPLVVAKPGDIDCCTVAVRSWHIDPSYWQLATVVKFVEDSQQTVRKMLQDFPNLCDMYGTSLNPQTEALAQTLGFHSTTQDPNMAFSWLYLPVDKFLEKDDISGCIADLLKYG